MTIVVQLSPRPLLRRPSPPGVAALCVRLCAIEAAASADEAMMDILAEAERTLLQSLARTPSETMGEAEMKFGAMVRRAEAADGFLSEDELDVMHSALGDLQRLRPASVVA